MGYGTAILLGLLQAITEFLPISSSGHLILFRCITRDKTLGDHLLFDVMLHVGTLVAVVAVYWRELLKVLAAVVRAAVVIAHGHHVKPLWNRDPDLRLAAWLVVATIPAAVAGVFLDRAIKTVGGYASVVALLLLLNGWVLFFASRCRVRQRPMTVGGAATVGLAQAAALLPGLSRSGMTISAAMANGQDGESAARFSFLLSVPAVIGAAVLTLRRSAGAGQAANWGPMLVGMVVSAVIGYGALRLLLRVLRRGRFGFFAYYCWAAALAVIIWTRIP